MFVALLFSTCTYICRGLLLGPTISNKHACMVLCQVLPEYLKKTIGDLLTDPFASACLPDVAAAMRPLLKQLQPKAAELLSQVALAASQCSKLKQVLQSASQVI